MWATEAQEGARGPMTERLVVPILACPSEPYTATNGAGSDLYGSATNWCMSG